MGDTKVQNAAPAHTAFSFSSPVEGEPLFILERERLQALYLGAYTQGTTSTSEGAENLYLNVKLSARTHPGAAGLDSPLGGDDPSPI